MFYADFVLSKKGPLSKVWLAAHWEKKLSKAQIYETDVDEAVSEIMRPSQNLALRTTGHLLLGICRVFSRKTKYLLADCNEAFLKIKLVFRNGALDEPNPVIPEFNMQELYGDFGDTSLPEFDEEDLKHAPICQSRLDDITMKEDLPTKSSYNYGELLEDDDFGEIAAGVVPEDYYRIIEEVQAMDIEEMKRKAAEEAAREKEAAAKAAEEAAATAAATASEIHEEEKNMVGREREETPLLKDIHAPGGSLMEDDHSGAYHEEEEDEEDHEHQSSSYDNQPMQFDDMDYGDDPMPIRMAETPLRDETPSTFRAGSPAPSVAPSAAGTVADQDTVESYYERQAAKRALQKEQNKKKHRIDEIRMMTGDEMKSNMADFSDTLTRLDLAPPTRQLMRKKIRGGAEFLMHMPGMYNFARAKIYVREYQEQLRITKHTDIEEKNEEIKQAMGLWDVGEEDLQKQQQEMDLAVQDDPHYDDFDEIAPLDLDALDRMDMAPQYDDYDMSDDIPMRDPLSPFTMRDPDDEGDDDEEPSEKRRRLLGLDDEDTGEDGDEDNRWSKRTVDLLDTIKIKLEGSDRGVIELDDMMKRGITRKTAAGRFYSALVLQKNQCIQVEQKTPFAEIYIKKGPNIDAVAF